MKVAIILADGFEEIEAIALIDILRRAGIDANFAGLNNKSVLGAHKILLATDLIIDDINSNDFSMIVLPGGMPGAENLKNSTKLLKLLKEFDDKNLLIGAICASPWVLGEAGVIKTSYTCYPGFEKNVNKAGYKDDQDVVVDKNIITSRGPGTAFAFALEIVKELCGQDCYLDIKNKLLYKG